MAATDLTTLTPVKLNSAVLAAADLNFDPGINAQEFRHSGNLYSSDIIKQAVPQLTFRTPLDEAYDLIGLSFLKCTAVEWMLATYSDYAKQSGINHVKRALATSATAVATIEGFSERDGVIMANVRVLLLSSDGKTHPVGAVTTAALNTLASEPTLHRRGPIEINGTRVSGVRAVSGTLNHRFFAQDVGADGNDYLRTVAYDGSTPMLQIDHNAPKAALAEIGLTGANITADVVVYLRQIGTDYYAGGSTGWSITVGSGVCDPGPIEQGVGQADRMGIMVRGLSTDSTHPWTVSASATLPAA